VQHSTNLYADCAGKVRRVPDQPFVRRELHVSANILRTVNQRTHNAFTRQIHYGTPTMPRGDKSKYTDKQDRKADHIAESYEQRGVPEQEAERRAWATVNKETVAATRAAPDAACRTTMRPRARAAASVAAPRPHAPPPRDRRPRPASGTPSAAPTEQVEQRRSARHSQAAIPGVSRVEWRDTD
jgi:plasmid stabilization system protein ParE